MGYSHYWYVPDRLDNFDQFAAEATRIAGTAKGMHATILVSGVPGSKAVRVGSGSEELVIEEMFAGRRKPGDILHFNSVKTHHAAHDSLVIAILASLKSHDPRVIVSSDGDANDWAKGLQLYGEATGKTATYETLVRSAG
jgi:hypothetical protein